MASTETTPIIRRDLAAVLAELETDGMDLGTVVDRKITEVTRAVVDSGRKGTVTLELSIAAGKPGQVTVGCNVRSKVPEPVSEARAFFVRPADGALTREDPRQLKMKHLDMPAPTLRTVRGDAE